MKIPDYILISLQKCAESVLIKNGAILNLNKLIILTLVMREKKSQNRNNLVSV